jgi:hypothetical protein
MENHLRHTDRQGPTRPRKHAARARNEYLGVEFQFDTLAPPGSGELGLLIATFPSILGELVEAPGEAAKD